MVGLHNDGRGAGVVKTWERKLLREVCRDLIRNDDFIL